ncbi:hypothetical protein [Stenotrophomonas sp.]|uniref:hypothetical protein n=1 Tax=Stenotrophomonas sp. TaxID=69392 RepID=UPI002FC7EF4A
MTRATSSIADLRRKGQVANILEVSADVWGGIQMGGFNHAQRDVFAGLPVQVKHNLVDHIQAVHFVGWIKLEEGVVEGRTVTLSVYLPDATFGVSTTQLNTTVVPGYASDNSHVFPSIIDAGSAIEVHGRTAAALVPELEKIGFSAQAAHAIASTAAARWP